jgi:hypothetical protein
MHNKILREREKEEFFFNYEILPNKSKTSCFFCFFYIQS